LLTKILNHPTPVRKVILTAIRKAGIGSYAFRLGIGAVNRPHYAFLVSSAARLAKKLGLKRISILEYGVAGGQGLVALEEHAREVEKLYSVGVDIYGFDTGKGLPPPKDYRDLPYHWKEGFFAMEPERLKVRLERAKLVLGDISETAKTFFQQYQPAPIGAVIQDFDYYSSTMDALNMLKADSSHFLPRVFCYFDDTIGTEIELYNDYTGERLAIRDFNEENERIKLCPPYYLVTRRPEGWHQQIWICHFFDHPLYNKFVSDENQQLRI
jgi:hypothetical protein